jgi:multidrug efflux pump
MTGMIDWATQRARMIFAFIALSIGAGALAYVGLPKEGEPDIDIPMVFVSSPFPGISASDSERLMVKPLETELREVDGLDTMTTFASEGYAGALLEFKFGWDKPATLAQVREAVDKATNEFPDGYEEPSVDEFNFSEFPILVVSLSGDVPERTLLKLSKDMQRRLEGLPQVLEAGLAGHREEMLEVVIDPLKLEAYDITGQELVNVVVNNNRLVAAGAVESGSGQFSVKLPGSFETPRDVYDLPVKVNGDRVVTMGDIADIRLTFEDRQGTARYNGRPTVALQIVKRKGEPVIDTVATVKEAVARGRAAWPEPLREAVRVDYSMDQSTQVEGMVGQLESSVLTAIALVMIVVLAALGLRSAFLVGFAIPTSFLLCFGLLAVMGMSITNIVMFGLILAVGMLVDGAIVVVEYADQRIRDGMGPMRAYAAAAKRMFWPIVSSTATTLCAFLPMLFWPGMPGEFMGNLPVTLIFVLSASLVVALLYLPVVGGVSGRITRAMERGATALQSALPRAVRGALFLLLAAGVVGAAAAITQAPDAGARIAAALATVALWMAAAVAAASFRDHGLPPPGKAGYRRSLFGHVIRALTHNPVTPFLAIAATLGVVGWIMTSWYPANSHGTEFFVDTEPERAVVYVRARGNLSLDERDRLLKDVEDIILRVDGVDSVFAFAGDGGLNDRGGNAPKDAVGRIQIELAPWDERPPGDEILAAIETRIEGYPGVISEIAQNQEGPQQGKPVQLRVTGDDWEELLEAAAVARAKFERTEGLVEIEDTRPLPGIDWELDVDVSRAGRFGADVGQIGPMVSMITRGILLDTMRPDDSEEEIEIRVRYPEEDRVISTLDTMRIRTNEGLVPLENFVERRAAPKLGEINRVDGKRFFDVKADVRDGGRAPPPRLGRMELDRRPGGAGRIPAVPDEGLRRRAGADVRDPAGAVQLDLQLGAGALGRGHVRGRGAGGHGGHGPALLDHHDGHRHRGAGGHRGEQQHRADRHLPGIRPPDAAAGGDRAHGRAAHPPRAADDHHHHGRPYPDDVRHLGGLLRRRLLPERPHRPVVEAARHRGRLGAGHGDDPHPGRHPRRPGRAGLARGALRLGGRGALAPGGRPRRPGGALPPAPAGARHSRGAGDLGRARRARARRRAPAQPLRGASRRAPRRRIAPPARAPAAGLAKAADASDTPPRRRPGRRSRKRAGNRSARETV